MRPVVDSSHLPRVLLLRHRDDESGLENEFRLVRYMARENRQVIPPLWMTAGRIACLNHEVRYDTVKEQSVVEALTYQFKEVVAVNRRVIV